MVLRQELGQRQTQQLSLTPQMQQSLRMLRMPAAELADFLREEAEGNPLLLYQPPALANTVSGDGSQWQEVVQTRTLTDHVLSQIGALRLSAVTARLAKALVGELQADGYLVESLEEFAHRNSVPLKHAKSALEVLQSCDPAGIGARDLAECFRLQLIADGRFDALYDLILQNLERIAKGQLSAIAAANDLDEGILRSHILDLRTLDPKPGHAFTQDVVQVRIPDVIITEHKGSLRVALNEDAYPRLSFATLPEELKSADSAQDWLKERKAHARWLLRSVAARATTILAVVNLLVQRQAGFFRHGPGGLTPLTMQGVAEELQVAISTISRIANGKSFVFQHSTYPIKILFSSAVGNSSGSAVRARIAALIESEDGARPLSDQQLVELLHNEGIDIARRTIAKYRGSLGIASSVQRKRKVILNQ